MTSGTRFRLIVATMVFVLIGGLGLAAGQSAVAKPKKPNKPKLGKEGNYSQVFKNRPGLWQDDTSITAWVRNRKVVMLWVTSNYKLDGGGWCSPIGFTGALMPDKTLTGAVWVTIKPKKPVALNARSRFKVPIWRGNPFYEGSGSVKGRLINARKMTLTAKFSQAANRTQGRCSTNLTVPKAKFTPMKLDGIVD